MKATFSVRVLHFEILREIDGVWTTDDFARLLEEMDFGDTAGIDAAELRDLCLLSLQDLEPEQAAALVLAYYLGDHLTEGQIQNVAHEMPDEKQWEEYADLLLHEGMFNVGSLLYAAFPRVFPVPDAVRVVLNVSATNEEAREALAAPLHESFLVRLLADGMPETAILKRLFEEQLDGSSFPEAEAVVWTTAIDRRDADAVRIEIISSGYWLDALRDTEAYQSTAYADAKRGRS